MWRAVNLVEFADVDTCAFFYPGRTLAFHRTINSLIAREVRSRGGEVTKTVITKDYGRERDCGNATRYSRSSLQLVLILGFHRVHLPLKSKRATATPTVKKAPTKMGKGNVPDKWNAMFILAQFYPWAAEKRDSGHLCAFSVDS